MPRAETHAGLHPLALFCLFPLTDRATAVLGLPANKHLLSRLRNGDYVLDIGRFRSKSSDYITLATIGRNGDVVVDAYNISRIQCSFEIDPVSNVVMFYDKSHSQTSQVFCQNRYQFEYGRPRKIVVLQEFKTVIGMGGVRRDLFQFELRWYSDDLTVTMQRAKDRVIAALEVNPQLALTTDAANQADTQLPSRWQTRVHTAGPRQPTVRYLYAGLLGRGTFGDVHKVLDVDSGKFMAVKLLKPPNQASTETAMKREVETLSRISHVSEISSTSLFALLHNLISVTDTHCRLHNVSGLGYAKP